MTKIHERTVKEIADFLEGTMCGASLSSDTVGPIMLTEELWGQNKDGFYVSQGKLRLPVMADAYARIGKDEGREDYDEILPLTVFSEDFMRGLRPFESNWEAIVDGHIPKNSKIRFVKDQGLEDLEKQLLEDPDIVLAIGDAYDRGSEGSIREHVKRYFELNSHLNMIRDDNPTLRDNPSLNLVRRCFQKYD